MGHPVLRQTAKPISDPTAPDVKSLVSSMVETMADAGGTGLAAPQVHVPFQLVVYFVQADREGDGGQDVPLTTLINPEIEPLSEEIDYDWEGCLSVPGLRGLVPRHRRIRYTALTPEGTRLEQEAEGFHARVVQHECDHLAGILYPQRMDDLSLLLYEDELRHGIPEKARALMEKHHGPAETAETQAG